MADEVEHTLAIEEIVHPPNGSVNDEWLHSILEAKSPPSSTTKIHKVPKILKENKDHHKHYVPKVVSLGPYHHGNPDLNSVEGFKPLFTNKLVEENQCLLHCLYNNLAEMVHTLRGYYEDHARCFSDDKFTRMMLLDGCFVVYFIEHIFLNNETGTLGLKSHQVMFVQEDMFLLENQIPYQVLTEVVKFMPHMTEERWNLKVKRFIDDNIFATEMPKKRGQRKSDQSASEDLIPTSTNHLLELLQTRHTYKKSLGKKPNNRYTFRNVNELIEVGIHFKPSKFRSLAHINFRKCSYFYANLELPPITIDDSTKPMLLNLAAYEMCSNDTNASWVTSYICLLDSLIDHSVDVKILRKAGIIDNRLGSDEEVAELFNEIGTDLVPNSFAYSDIRHTIQQHYNSKRNTWISQLKHEYIKSPWAFVALLVGVIGLFLGGVQAYFSVWGLAGPCDSLCTVLKETHHL